MSNSPEANIMSTNDGSNYDPIISFTSQRQSQDCIKQCQLVATFLEERRSHQFIHEGHYGSYSTVIDPTWGAPIWNSTRVPLFGHTGSVRSGISSCDVWPAVSGPELWTTPTTLDHPKDSTLPQMQSLIQYLCDSEWYNKGCQEPTIGEYPELGLPTKQSSSTPISVFGDFFSARQPYDCLLCSGNSSKRKGKPKRTLERALGHIRAHFSYKPIQANRKTYTNLNTKKDQECTVPHLAKFCIPCQKKMTHQNWKPHTGSSLDLRPSISISSDGITGMYDAKTAETMKKLREGHADTISTSSNPAVTYRALGHLDETEVFQSKVLRVSKELYGERHPKTIFASNNLAPTYHDLGQLDESKVLMEEALRVADVLCMESSILFKKAMLGERHPDTLDAIHDLADTYRRLGRFKEAEGLQEQVLGLRKETLGELHPDTITASHNLALTYCGLGRYNEAEALQANVLRRRREILGEQHPDTIGATHILADTYRHLGRFNEAKGLQKQVLNLMKETLGELRPDTITASHNPAPIYHDLGRHIEPEALRAREPLRGDIDSVNSAYSPDGLNGLPGPGEMMIPPGDPDLTYLNGQVVIPDYRLPKFGRVSLVHRGLWRGKQVAVKVLKAQKRRAQATNWERGMRREVNLAASMWAALKHPNILPFYGYSDDFGNFGAFISPWCKLGTAQDYLESRDLSYSERLRLTKGMCEGLRYLHQLSLVHGDLKPTNVLIDDGGVTRIGDFGLSTLARHQELGELTRTTVYDGPERYMAPELFASADGHPLVPTFEGDIYSFGCVALEFIERLCPFQRLSTDHGVINAILSGHPPALRCESKCKPPAVELLWDLLGACWSSQPAIRPNISAVSISIAALEFIMFDDATPVPENTRPENTEASTQSDPSRTYMCAQNMDSRVEGVTRVVCA